MFSSFTIQSERPVTVRAVLSRFRLKHFGYDGVLSKKRPKRCPQKTTNVRKHSAYSPFLYCPPNTITVT